MMEVNQITCKGCGAPVSVSDSKCPYCRGPVCISTFQNVYDIPVQNLNRYVHSYQEDLCGNPDDFEANKATAFCYLKVKMYEKAMPFFDRAIEHNFNDSDLYLYAAICLLKGKRPFFINKKYIDQAIQYMNAACMISDKGIYHYFLAYLKFDYYELKGLRITPAAVSEMQTARRLGVTKADAENLFALMGTPRPNGF